MPATSQIIESLLTELLNLVPPCEEDWLISELAGLVVAGCHLEYSLVRQLANELPNLSQLLLRLPDHCDLESLFLPLKYPNKEIDLLSPHLPIAPEALLNCSHPFSRFNDILLDLCSHLFALEHV